MLCGLIGIRLLTSADPDKLVPFQSSFLTITFAAVTFSVTFSISGFNSSAYRQFHKNLPPRLLLACVALVISALTPLVILVFWPRAFAQVSLLLLSLLTAAAGLLMEIARRETDPVALLNRLCSKNVFAKYFQNLAKQIDVRISETKALELSKPTDRPTHEFSWHLSVPTSQDDPLTCMATLGLLAIQNNDSHALSRVMMRFLDVLSMATTMEFRDTKAHSFQVSSGVQKQIYDAFEKVVFALKKDANTVCLARVAIDVMAEFAVMQVREHKQTNDLTGFVLYMLECLAHHCYKSGSTREIHVSVIVARQLAQKGMDDPLKGATEQPSVDESLFNFALPGLLRVVKRVGSMGIENNDSQLLYRCLDALAYTGCSAVKHQHMQVATACLRNLAQLGREARAKDLECFWDRCPLRPSDHADERIGWIASWVFKIPEDQRDGWISLVEKAYSRLTGKETTLEYGTDKEGKPFVKRHDSKKPYCEPYLMEAAGRDVDYSDFQFLKDLELHPERGTLVQGPAVPFVPAD